MNEKICPLLSISGHDIVFCQGAKCAWWHKEYENIGEEIVVSSESCALIGIVDKLSVIERYVLGG